MLGTERKLGFVAALATLMMAGGMAGCSSLSSNHVDCNVVRLQSQAGRSDTEIASALGVSVSDLSACKGPETSGNTTSGGAPGPY